MSDLRAELVFVTGMRGDAALVSINSNCENMVSDDIYDCGVYDWIAYNLDIEIPKSSRMKITVNVSPSYWGNGIDEINYTIDGDVLVCDINLDFNSNKCD